MADTLMCACAHHFSVHPESRKTAPGRPCWGYVGSDTPGPLRELCPCQAFEPWTGPWDARTGLAVKPITLYVDARLRPPEQYAPEPNPEDPDDVEGT